MYRTIENKKLYYVYSNVDYSYSDEFFWLTKQEMETLIESIKKDSRLTCLEVWEHDAQVKEMSRLGVKKQKTEVAQFGKKIYEFNVGKN